MSWQVRLVLFFFPRRGRGVRSSPSPSLFRFSPGPGSVACLWLRSFPRIPGARVRVYVEHTLERAIHLADALTEGLRLSISLSLYDRGLADRTVDVRRAREVWAA